MAWGDGRVPPLGSLAWNRTIYPKNRWSDYVKNRMPAWGRTPTGHAFLTAAGVFLTFNYVSLGWLFFTLPTPGTVWNVMAVLFGVV